MDSKLFEDLSKTFLCQPDRIKESINDRTKMTIVMEVTESQGLALQAMFEYWNQLASAGGSRKVAFYVDGDGNFKPNCDVKFENMTPKLTDEMRDIAIVEDNDGDRTYDFDPIAWKLHDLREEKKER